MARPRSARADRPRRRRRPDRALGTRSFHPHPGFRRHAPAHRIGSRWGSHRLCFAGLRQPPHGGDRRAGDLQGLGDDLLPRGEFPHVGRLEPHPGGRVPHGERRDGCFDQRAAGGRAVPIRLDLRGIGRGSGLHGRDGRCVQPRQAVPGGRSRHAGRLHPGLRRDDAGRSVGYRHSMVRTVAGEIERGDRRLGPGLGGTLDHHHA